MDALPHHATLASRLLYLRVRAGLASTACSLYAGLAHSTVARLEDGSATALGAGTACRLARLLALPSEDWRHVAAWLVCGHTDPRDWPLTPGRTSKGHAAPRRGRVKRVMPDPCE